MSATVVCSTTCRLRSPAAVVSLLGASGAGKTSLLRVMAGLAPATRGEVVASDGQPIQGRLAWMGQKDLLTPAER